nr:GNAT family N-acetyltransferase [Hungatella hathewayi]
MAAEATALRRESPARRTLSCYIPKGCFHSFPYLHLIAVKEEYRGQGIGRKLIDYLENVVCANAHRLFLFNRKVHPVK